MAGIQEGNKESVSMELGRWKTSSLMNNSPQSLSAEWSFSYVCLHRWKLPPFTRI